MDVTFCRPPAATPTAFTSKHLRAVRTLQATCKIKCLIEKPACQEVLDKQALAIARRGPRILTLQQHALGAEQHEWALLDLQELDKRKGPVEQAPTLVPIGVDGEPVAQVPGFVACMTARLDLSTGRIPGLTNSSRRTGCLSMAAEEFACVRSAWCPAGKQCSAHNQHNTARQDLCHHGCLPPGKNLSSCGPTLRKDRYPTMRSSSRWLPNMLSSFLTAGGGPEPLPEGFICMAQVLSNRTTAKKGCQRAAWQARSLVGQASLHLNGGRQHHVRRTSSAEASIFCIKGFCCPRC